MRIVQSGAHRRHDSCEARQGRERHTDITLKYATRFKAIFDIIEVVPDKPTNKK
jgi:hypothetical protein